MIVLTLHKGKEQSLLRFHPWVFSGAIKHMSDTPCEGDIVEVRAFDGSFLGLGHYEIGSIAVRILSFTPCDINDAFWTSRISEAYKLRQTLNLERDDNDTFRLIHGEGDSLPGLIVDIYRNSAVVQAHSVGMHYARNAIANALMQIIPSLRSVYYKSSSTLPHKAKITDNRDDGYLIGHADASVEPLATENGYQ